MAGPMAFSRFINILSGLVGMMFAAHLGPEALAATALLNAAGAFVYLIGMSILFAIGVVVAQLVGAGHDKDVGELFQQAISLAMIISVPVSLLYWFMGDILLWAGQSPVLVRYILPYFRVLSIGALSLFALVVMQQMMYALKKQRVVMISNVFTFIPFVILAYGLILGHLGMPKLGVEGLAYAFIFLNFLNTIVLATYAYRAPEFKRYELFESHPHASQRHVGKLLRVGWPMAVQFGGEFLTYFLIILMVGWMGDTDLSGFQVVIQWQQLVIVPIFGVSEATGILTGHAAGAKRFEQLMPIMNATLVIVSIVSCVIAAVYVTFYRFLASFYVDVNALGNKNLVHLVGVLFSFAIVSRFFDNIKIVISGALRGLHDTRFAMWISVLLSLFLALPLGYVLAVKLHYGPVGFIVANGLVFMLNDVFLIARWRRQCRLIQSV